MILGTSIIPKIERTHEMIRTGIIPQYKARIILAIDVDQHVDEVDISKESFVWYKNRLFRPQQFLTLYLQIPQEERFKVLSFSEPYFRSVETDADQLVKDFFKYVAEEVHLMMKDHGGCKVVMSGTELVSLHQETGGLMPHEVPGYESRDRRGYTDAEWREYNRQWTEDEWEDWRARRTGRHFHHHSNRSGWGWDNRNR